MRMLTIALTILIVVSTSAPSLVFADTHRQAPDASTAVLQTDKQSYLLNNKEEVGIEIIWDYEGSESQFDVLLEAYITAPSGEVVFDSGNEYGDSSGEYVLKLRKGTNRKQVFSWTVHSSSETGTYTLTAALRDNDDPSIILREWTADDSLTFEILEKSTEPEKPTRPTLEFSPESWTVPIDKFTTYGDIYETTIEVTSAGQEPLTWQVANWPEWIEVLDPTTEVSGPGKIRLRVKAFDTGYYLQEWGPIFWIARSQTHSGSIEVTSNGKEGSIEVNVPSLPDKPRTFFRDNRIQNPATGLLGKITVDDYNQGETAKIEVKARNNFYDYGNVPLDYLVNIEIRSSSGKTVYNSSDEEDGQRVYVEDGGSEAVTFLWDVPQDLKRGEYLIGAEMRYWFDQAVLFDVISGDGREEFHIRQAPKVPKLAVSSQSVNFGTIVRGEAPEAVISVDNAGLSTLEWRVWKVPTWLEIIIPSSTMTGPGELKLKVKGSAPIGPNTAEIRIRSNGGSQRITVTVTVEAPPTPAPTPMPTPEPTPPAPVATTATPVVETAATLEPALPAPTAVPSHVTTAAVPTVTPPPTAALLNATATASPTPVARTATAVPSPMTPSSTTLPSQAESASTSFPVVPAAKSTPELTGPTAQPTAPEAPASAAPLGEVGLDQDQTPPAAVGSSCNVALGNVSLGTGLLNSALLLAPLGLIVFRKKRKAKYTV